MDPTDARILNRIQRDFPLVERPFLALADELGLTEDEVLSRVEGMKHSGVIRSISPVFDPPRLGLRGALMAAQVDPEALASVADAVSALPEVSHNYQRDHAVNLWFTVMGASEERLQEIAETVRKMAGVRQAELLPATRKFKLQVLFDMASGADA